MLIIGAVNYRCVWYKLPEGIKAVWSLGQAYYYSGGPTEITAMHRPMQTSLTKL